MRRVRPAVHDGGRRVAALGGGNGSGEGKVSGVCATVNDEDAEWRSLVNATFSGRDCPGLRAASRDYIDSVVN